MSSPQVPEPMLAVQAVSQLTDSTEHDYVTSMLAAWGQFLMDDLVATANGNKVTITNVLMHQLARMLVFT